jgi:SH3 domain protein
MSYSCAMKKMINGCAASLLSALLFVSAASAESAWVSDEFEITLRSGPSTSNAIELMLSSGTELEVLERDAESGYSRVRTGGGTEGWVLTRYLMNEPAAREQLARLTSQLTNEASRGSSLNAQLGAIRSEHDTATKRIETLEREKSGLEEELAEIQRTAANVLAINNQNKQLREELAAEEIRVATLEQENRELSGQTTRYWFMSGALVLVVGMVLGLWLPRIRWQRRSRYDRF